MNEKSIGYCGLVCSFCCPDGKCSCKSENHCGKRLSPQGCYQYNCCTAKGIKGCWECSDSPCDKDMLAPDKIKMRAFIQCIKEDGIEKFISYLEQNEKDGVVYHRTGIMGDYDLPGEKEVLNLLRLKGESIEMEQIELIEPEMKYADDIWKFRQEILDNDADSGDQFAGCISLDVSMSAEEWIKICALRKREETCGEAGTTVPSHMYLAVRKSDNRVIGMIDLRHHINHPILGTWGGHCGYSVRPSERGKGYAKEMLRMNILNAKALGIPKLLIVCEDKNKASEKTILANGGVYEKTIDVDGCKMKRYWIMVNN